MTYDLQRQAVRCRRKTRRSVNPKDTKRQHGSSMRAAGRKKAKSESSKESKDTRKGEKGT
jgi:hypothetical protein